MTRIREEEEEV